MKKTSRLFLVLLFFLSFFFLGCVSTRSLEKAEIKALLLQGESQLYSEQYDDAIISYKAIITINKDHKEGLYGLARSYILNGELDKGAEVIFLLTKIDEESAFSLKETYARLLADSGRESESIDYLSSLYATNPYDKDLAFSLIETLLNRNEFDKAYAIALQLYFYRYDEKDVIKKIAEIAEKGNLPDKDSWALLAK